MTEFDSELDRRRVMAASHEELGASVAGDPERYFNILTGDAVFLPPNSLPKAGPELRQGLRDFLAQVAVECLDSVHGETVVAGDIAYHEYACT